MIRFVFRFIGLWLLAGAFAALVVDGTRSVSASRFVFTPVRAAWAMVDPAGLHSLQQKIAGHYAETAVNFALAAPFFALLAAAALFLLAIGRRKRERVIGYSSRD